LGSKTMQTISITYTMMQNCILKQCHKFSKLCSESI
jgi:hypothetical protein